MLKRKNLSRKDLHIKYHNMYDRCYRESYLENNPKYRGCSVCDEWLEDKESFFDWVAENYYIVPGEQMDLDKDILIKGNKIYSPDTCIFVPHKINAYFENCTREPVFVQTQNKFKMDINIDGKMQNIGYFDTEKEAKLEYIKHKQAHIIAIADKYKRQIPKQLYNAMISWKIELLDWNR